MKDFRFASVMREKTRITLTWEAQVRKRKRKRYPSTVSEVS